jgi:ribonuclease BN (tRNA processing enzyme)
VRLTVLGKSPSWQDAGGACSGYLVEDGDSAMMLDCGSGVFAKLRERRDYAALDAVVLSHLHADHILDLVPYASALTYGPRERPTPITLHAPPGAREAFRRICGGAGMDPGHIERTFALREYEPALAVGTLRVRFCPVPHFVPTWAVEVVGEDGGRLTYSADTGPSGDLIDFARGTDLLLLEATIPEPERQKARGHLTPAEAGGHGRDAGARRVVLTHVSDELDASWVRAQAAEAFGAPVDLAEEGAVYEVRRPG